MNVIAFDPATKTGWAYKKRCGEWVCGTVNPDNSWAVIAVMTGAIVDGGVEKAVFESTYLAVNPKTRSRLDEIRGQLRGCCCQLAVDAENVSPLTWKAAMLKEHGRLPKGRKAQKARAMAVAKELGANPENADEADAVCLCEWARTREKVHMEWGDEVGDDA